MEFTVLVIFILVVLILWWALLRSAKKYKPDFAIHEHEEAEAHADDHHPSDAETGAIAMRSGPSVELKPLPTAESGVADDLTILEGIGPRVSQLLQQNGIHTFAHLAAADTGRLREILDAANLRFMDPGTWSEQARLAAEGRMDELKELMGRLQGGRSLDQN